MLESHKSPLHIGAVTLIAKDRLALGRYYQEVIGLEVIAKDDDRLSLGSGGEATLHLLGRPDAKLESPRSAGLFHTAFLLPSRSALGHWFKGTLERGAQFQGASDHGVSEAFYLTDPEGNGIEVYADRPRDSWPKRGEGYAMTTDRMDVEGVVNAGLEEKGASGFPPQARIGHVHLRVGDIEAVQAFYREGLGLAEMDRRPGGVFYGAGGYHHHLATNQWQSNGAGQRANGTTGLAEVEIAVSAPAMFTGMAERFSHKNSSPIRVTDPAGIIFAIRQA